jgi:signal transduction histidine kinase
MATASEILEELKKLKEERSSEFVSQAEQRISEAGNDKMLQLRILYELSSYYNHQQSNYRKANELAYEALNLAQDLNEKVHQAKALNLAGVNHNFIGELSKARDAYEQGIKIMESLYELSADDKTILASLYFNNVTLYKEFELDESRLQYIDKAFKLFTEAGNRQGVARCYLSYANNYPGIRNTEKAIEYYQQAADIFRELQDKRGEGNSLINIGYQRCLKGDFEPGVGIVNEGISLLEKSGSAVFVTNGYFLLGICKRLQGKFEEAKVLFQKVEDITIETKASFNMATLYEEWAQALESSGDFKGALEMYKRYYRDMENMYKFDKSSAVSDARMTFELEERKREADILKNKNREIEAYTHRLEISNAELRQFAHVASHDLKEPLRMVTLYMQLLEKNVARKLNDDELQYLYFAKEGASRMYGLIESLLQLSKINPDIKTETVDLNKVLNEAAEFMRPDMQKKSFRISTVVLPKVKANHSLMLQLFENLIGNAIKFNQSAAPTMEISCEKKEGAYLFTFRDNGIGIEKKYREKVFDIFQRLHAREAYQGTGIGLTICKKIIEQMNGKIWIEDGKENGCAFCFTIPC